MHAGAVDSRAGLWHERGIQAVPLGNGLYRQLEGLDIVRRGQRLSRLKIDFMLGGGRLVMGTFHHKSHLLQCQHNIAPRIFSQIEGADVKISGLLMADGGGPCVVIQMEQEKFAFRSHLEQISHFRRFPQRPLQDIPGVPLKGRPVRTDDIADQARHLALLGPPWKNLQRIRVRLQIQV